MGASTQTRFDTTLNGDITDIQTTLLLDAAPAFTTGYGTLERGGASEEDIYWAGVSGLQLTGLLRGLSQTALTNTEVSGNKKAHVDDVAFEGTLLHYIINDKASKSGNDAITGSWTFNTQLPTSTDTPEADAELTTKVYVDLKGQLSGGNTWAGVQIFADDGAESTTNAAPSSDKKFANKKYVDDQVTAGVGSAATESAKGLVELATLVEQGAHTETGSVGPLALQSKNTIKVHATYTPGFLTGDTGAETNVSLWDSESIASFRATIDGTAANYDGIDFTAGHTNGIVTDMDGVAARIQYEIRAVTGKTETCVWSTNHFIITSANTTSSSAISVLSTSTGTVGTDISGAGASDWMDADTGNGVATAAVLDPTQDANKVLVTDSNGKLRGDIVSLGSGISSSSGAIILNRTDTNDFVDSSAGAGDAGKAVILDAAGTLDVTMVAGEASSQITSLNQTLGVDRYITHYSDLGDSFFTATLLGGESAATTTTFGKRLKAGTTGGQAAVLIADNPTFDNGFGSPDFDWDNDFFLIIQARITDTTTQDIFFGEGISVVTTGSGVSVNATDTSRHCGFFIEDGTLYASNADGTTQKKTDISAGIDLTNYNTYLIEFTSSSIVFKVNGVVKATHTDNIPTGATDFGMVFGIQAAGTSRRIAFSRTVVFGQKAT